MTEFLIALVGMGSVLLCMFLENYTADYPITIYIVGLCTGAVLQILLSSKPAKGPQ